LPKPGPVVYSILEKKERLNDLGDPNERACRTKKAQKRQRAALHKKHQQNRTFHVAYVILFFLT
jgi:heme exporter protein D